MGQCEVYKNRFMTIYTSCVKTVHLSISAHRAFSLQIQFQLEHDNDNLFLFCFSPFSNKITLNIAQILHYYT